MPKDTLDNSVSKLMGWWSPAGYDAYPEKTQKVVGLIKQAEAKARIDEANIWADMMLDLVNEDISLNKLRETALKRAGELKAQLSEPNSKEE